MHYRSSRIAAVLLSATVLGSSFTTPVFAEDPAEFAPGATVVQDASSPSGYTVHFVYDASKASKKVTGVQVTGPFSYTTNEKDRSYTPEEYQNGMYATNAPAQSGKLNMGLPWGYTKDMTDEDENGTFETSFPITSGSFGYHYIVTYEDGTSESIADPANLPDKLNPNGYKNSNDTTTSIVEGHWDAEKQSESPDMDYVLPTAAHKGLVNYVPYTGVDGKTYYAGVYTPYGYDANRAEPYKTIYISHGAGGDETDWYHMGSIDDIMDNYVEEGLAEAAIIVTMDNTAFGWDYKKTLPNIVDNMIPFIEKNYNVSERKEDRAMLGLSAGAMTTTNMFLQYPEEFGYFGMFSGTAVPDSGIEWKAEYAEPIVMATTGTMDFATSTNANDSSFCVERLDKWAKENIPDTYVTDNIYVKGSHDWFEWPQSFAQFIRDVAWKDTNGKKITTADYEDGVTVEDKTLTFVYDDDDERNAVKVTVTGNFQWYKWAETDGYDPSKAQSFPKYSAEEYEDDMFNTGYGLDGFVEYEMDEISGEHFTTQITVPGNLYYYDYNVTYADGTTVTIKDPANLPEANKENGHDAGHSLVYVGSESDTTKGQEYIYPRTDGKTGTYSFVSYTAVDGTSQPLGVYLPYDYDNSKTYKTIYVTHGGGGNENEWMTIGAIPNIMDNLIAVGQTDEAIVVTMDNTYFKWDYDAIGKNVTEHIMPYIEKHYSVSKEAVDRAFCGLSMGSATTNHMLVAYPDTFRYFGPFSGGMFGYETEHPEEFNVEELNKDVIYYANGQLDMARLGAEDLQDFLTEKGINYNADTLGGAHDWGLWREAFTNFAKDYLWTQTDVSYAFKSDTQTSFTKGDAKGLTVRADAAYNRFLGVRVDGKDVSSDNYTSKEGSTVVTLKQSYLDTLTAGEHTLTLVYDNGTADMKFNVADKSKAEDTKSSSTSKSANTGDTNNNGLFAGIFGFSAVIAAIALFLKKRMHA